MRFGQQSFWLGVAAGVSAIYLTLLPRPAPKPTESAAPAKPVDTVTDPEVLLEMAQREMREAQAKNRERAVQAIKRKNYIQAVADQQRQAVADFQDRIDFARWKGDEASVEQLLVEKTASQQKLADTEEALINVTEAVEQIKVAMRREEQRLQAKTNEAHRMKAQWLYLQVFDSLADAVSETSANALFDRAQGIVESARREKVEKIAASLKQIAGTLHREAEKAAQRGETAEAESLRADLATLRAAAL